MGIEANDELDRRDMERLCHGHDASLNDLMGRHAERLFHYLIRQLQDEDEAEDVAQETFVRVFQHRQKFDPKHRFATWLYTIATNLARTRQRTRTRHPQVSLEAENPQTGGGLKDTLPATDLGPEAGLERAERAAAVRKAVAQLPEDLRMAIVLFEYEEKSQAEIAAILDCTPKAVEMRLYHARRQLREQLKELL